ncbi:TPA: ead/Ea22-like family protein [Klebsiella pneumoniae]|uniref:ead/Ea22-like family protein n=1 Tax=Klebsiella pneumoniae TaxID=573 RepID=UPI0024A8F737|nr:ead/Ea22-like family protein [Klebsiella pneumoniae]HDO7134748.1 ead/Ea22-like family protein [Klebsiella pneumoniae]HDO7190121.1 ead/Ea22-like family protein [Klebsiella pneumoniae]
MTDITELAQSLKAAAEKATLGPWYVHDKPCEDGNYGIDTSDKEFLAEAVVWWGFARQSIWREEDAKYIALANPANILVLVEALEKSEKTSEARREAIDRTHNMFVRERDRASAAEEALEKAQQNETQASEMAVQLSKRLTAAENRISELENYAEAEAVGADKAAEDSVYWMNGCKELESRTVTVKLPDIMPPEAAPAHYWGSGESMAYADGYNKSAADLKTSFAQACSFAGVNVEFE